MAPERVAWKSHDLRGVRRISKMYGRLTGDFRKVGGGRGKTLQGTEHISAAGVVWSAALEAVVASGIVVVGGSGTVFRVLRVAASSARSVRGSLGHALAHDLRSVGFFLVMGLCWLG